MIKKIFLFVYFTFLCAIALSSMFFTWFNQPLFVFVMEVVIDLTLIAGIVLYSKKVFFKPWLFVFAIAMILQIYILIKAPYMEFPDFLAGLLILAPAVYMNIVVAGLFDREPVLSGDE